MAQKKPTVQEEAIRLHRYYRGKIETVPKCPVRTLSDFSIWYTPGVAAPCMEIKANKELAYDFTCKWNTIAIVSDGTRVLGLGDIGPEAAMPVMEGKALIFKYLGGVDAVPICLRTKDPDEIIKTVKLIQPSFGGINLEDISQPKCFYVLDTLRAAKDVDIPIWHDDQQGTATVVLAGILNALKVVGKPISQVKAVLLGSGAAGNATARLLFASGLDPKKTIVVDSKGILHKGRKDIEEKKTEFALKWEMCLKTNPQGLTGGIEEAMKGADFVSATSTPGPGIIKKEWIAGMAKNPIIFACANPTPEIYPDEAKAGGALIVATGRSDFPNQVNNSLVFPGLFRGVLDVRAKTITDEMCVAAATAIGKLVGSRLGPDFIVPTMNEPTVAIEVAVAAAMKAQEQGIAGLKLTEDEVRQKAKTMIERSQAVMRNLMDKGFIEQPPAA